MGNEPKYNSTVNVLGGVPDYAVMIDYLIQEYGDKSESDKFTFRTAKATTRFKKAVMDGFGWFRSDTHKELFINAIGSSNFSFEEKLIVLYWQLIICNTLFQEVTENIFLRALYSGRTTIDKSDAEAFIKHLKALYPDDITWSDSTIATTASKYLTCLKKFGFASGTNRKEIHAPHISSQLFVLLVKMALAVYPEDNTLGNPLFRFSFLDNQSIINRLKTIDYISLWDISQIVNDIKITLK